MSKELKPSWDGFLLLDEKMCSVRGKQQWWYLAVDGTGDIVHCRGVAELTATSAMSFLEELVHELKYPCRGIVTDLDAALRHAVEVVYPEKPHQYCLKHAVAALEELIGYKALLHRYRRNRAQLREQFTRMPGRRGIWVEHAREEFLQNYADTRALSRTFRQRKTLRDTFHAILFASSERRAVALLHRLRRSRQWSVELRAKVVAFLERHWQHLMQHHRVHGLPRTTNLVENVNRQLERRFKTIEAFQHRHTALGYVNLLVASLRQKPYTDCRGRRRHLNGHSRLHAAGVRLVGPWLANALKTTPKSNR
jgi:transposase-like protein